MIRFTKSSVTDLEEKYVVDALHNGLLSGDGRYTEKVYEQFKKRFGIERMLLTTSGTTALEMASILVELEPGDEVIVPSFTFSSTVNAFLLRGAKPVFCDIRKDTMNIDENLIENLITPKTKAIYCVDYAGIPCDIDKINEIANRHGLFVIEDAAQAVGSKYKGKYCGTLTEFGCYSFHETKNYVMGEGGGIVINEEKYMERAEIIREKGTNRRNVLRGLVDKYTWHDIGSSFLPSDVLAAILYAQMERYDEIMEKRVNIWNIYHEGLKEAESKGFLRRSVVPDYAEHNGHMYNIILPTEKIRTKLIAALKEKEIISYICYVPLHSAPMGMKLGYKPEDCPVTEDYGKRVLRLPLYADMTGEDAEFVAESVYDALGRIVCS
ncbi:MAG: dTDP-4-amino-4,6-dideoxygalactose transaminase [Ruminococcaceae bacterium]|nr:dTDP-4-amino-4,6-dideoxygalactose transaminase [Oscillospiraceae bacterium]